MKLKIYIMHSDKVDYKNEIYKPLLELGLLKDYFLILPLSKRFESSYIKELLIDSDIVLCDLTKSNIFLKTELKMANKLDKEIYYFINNTDKNKNKYKDLNITVYDNKEDYSNKVKVLLDSLNKKELLLKRENIFCLGKINK